MKIIFNLSKIIFYLMILYPLNADDTSTLSSLWSNKEVKLKNIIVLLPKNLPLETKFSKIHNLGNKELFIKIDYKNKPWIGMSIFLETNFLERKLKPLKNNEDNKHWKQYGKYMYKTSFPYREMSHSVKVGRITYKFRKLNHTFETYSIHDLIKEIDFDKIYEIQLYEK